LIPRNIPLQSKLKSQCEKCGEIINVGDEITRVGNGLWTHESCADKKLDVSNNKPSNLHEYNQKLLESKLERTKSLHCIYCGGISFLKPKLETVVLDDSSTLTKKLYPCYTCGHIMEFIEKIN
jgi:DNA-directed RNA polymerase subunit RPC12/RpoP